MKNTKKILSLLSICILVFSLFSCETVKAPKIPELTKYDDLMFWEINGADSNGKLSTIYVLGTIHVGDERLYPISQDIANAYGKADKIYGEISTEDWKMVVNKTAKRMQESMEEAKAIENERGFGWFETLSPEQQKYLEENINKAVLDSQKSNMPWVINSVVSETAMIGAGLNANYAYDTHFIAISNNLGIEMIGLDEIDVQIDIMSYGDIDFQTKLLTDTLDELIQDKNAVINETITLYETYLTGDSEKLASCLFDEMKEEIKENPGMEGYYNALFVDRNTNWAETFSQLLYEGGVTFVFAGSGHFVGKDSVFNIMKEKGDLIF